MADEEEEDDEEEEAQSQEEEEGLDDEPEDEGDSGDEYELSQYDYLVGKLHYDPDDKAVFKCHSVAVVGGLVVAYRCKYNSQSQKWGKVNMTDPVHVADIVGYHNNPTNDNEVNARLQQVPAATVKQRGRPKK